MPEYHIVIKLEAVEMDLEAIDEDEALEKAIVLFEHQKTEGDLPIRSWSVTLMED